MSCVAMSMEVTIAICAIGLVLVLFNNGIAPSTPVVDGLLRARPCDSMGCQMARMEISLAVMALQSNDLWQLSVTIFACNVLLPKDLGIGSFALLVSQR